MSNDARIVSSPINMEPFRVTRISATLRPCPVCTNRYDAEILHHQKLAPFADSGLPTEFDVVACSQCGMIYNDVPPRQETYDRLYADQSKYVRPSFAAGPEARRQQLTARTIINFLGRKDARILDVGCATGSLLLALKGEGCTKLTGMDPSQACAYAVRDTVGCPVAWGTLGGYLAKKDSQGFDAKFDCVILSHVLEHVADVRTALAAVRELLAPAGVAYIEVPDATRYAEHLVVPLEEVSTEHLNHFSGRHLLAVAASVGLDCVGTWGNKTFPRTEQHNYSAVFSFFRQGTAKEAPSLGVNGLRDAMKAYLDRSRQLWAAMETRMMGTLAGRQPIVWGTGELTYKLLAGPLGKLGVLGFVDSNPTYHNRELAGLLVRKPEDLKGLPTTVITHLSFNMDTKDVPILIASILHRESVVAAIHDLGLPNPIVTLHPSQE